MMTEKNNMDYTGDMNQKLFNTIATWMLACWPALFGIFAIQLAAGKDMLRNDAVAWAAAQPLTDSIWTITGHAVVFFVPFLLALHYTKKKKDFKPFALAAGAAVGLHLVARFLSILTTPRENAPIPVDINIWLTVGIIGVLALATLVAIAVKRRTLQS